MHRTQMAERCPHAIVAGTARLPAHRFIINALGWASAVPERDATVYGLLWELTDSDVEALDAYEGVAEGEYVPKAVIAERWPSGQAVDAWIYAATTAARGKPEPPYLAAIVEAAVSLGAPAEYIEELRGWGRMTEPGR
jgi:gamma-glutamylcyclotransferase (GGCT)/AIG2-like uncharacterized protein YtfP